MTVIVNLTQHVASEAQRDVGVVDLPDSQRQQLLALMTFQALPSLEEIDERAESIAELAHHSILGGDGDDPLPTHAMIGGAPYLMPRLESALSRRAIVSLYAFTQREVVEIRQADGSTKKSALFRHQGFVAS